MNTFRYLFVLAIIGTLAIFFIGCPSGGGDTPKEVTFKRTSNEVIIHELSNADMINPINSTDASATYIEGNIFQTLLNTDPETYEKYGLLAVDRPTITPIEEGEFKGGMKLEFEIRPEATWDNGTPITGHDYLFTIKTILNPKTNCEHLKGYFNFVGDIVIDEANPKKFAVYSRTTYMLVEEFSGYWVIPEYIYDPGQIMRKFTIRDLNTPEKRTALKGNTDIIKFAEDFNSEKFQREKGFVVGSGPYEFTSWETDIKIVLTRKKDWWGDKLKGTRGFDANPEKIVYQIINDMNTATTAMKDENIDVMRSIEPKKFTELLKNEDFLSRYNTSTPVMFSYIYLGMNMQNPKLKDVRVRQAISHLLNRDEIVTALYYDFAEPTVGPVHPKQSHYNKTLKGYDFNLDKAKQLLTEAGWVDTDGDGVIEKVIDGQNVPLKLEFKFNAGNDIRKEIGILFKEEARKVGIDVEIVSKEWTVFLSDLDNHAFEMYCGGWVSSPTMGDPYQIWHTNSSVVGGSNYVSFGTPESDQIIDSLRNTPSDEIRKELYMRLQEIISEQAPYVFLISPKERIAIHKRFTAKTYAARPGYDEKEFILNLPAASTEAQAQK